MAQPNYFDQFDDAPLTTGKPTNYFDQFDPTPAEIAAEAEPEPSFGERTMDTLSSAKTSITDELMGSETDMDTSNMDPAMLEAFGAPTTSALERTQGSVADTVGATANVVIDGGLSLIQSILPDSWEDSVIDFSRSAWEAVSQSPIMAEGIEAAKAGMKNYNEWAEKNPEWAKRLSDVVDVSSLGRTAGIKRAGVTPEHIKRGRTAGLKQKKNIRNNRVKASTTLTKTNGTSLLPTTALLGSVRWPVSWLRSPTSSTVGPMWTTLTLRAHARWSLGTSWMS